LVGKVLIKGERTLAAQSPHHFEIGAIYETESPAAGCDKRTDSGPVRGLVDPFDLNHRQHIVLKDNNSRHPESALYQRKAFNKHVVAADKCLLTGDDVPPDLSGLPMICIVGIQHSQKRGGVYENAHLKSSAR
jgi:hypothetical protein